MFKDIFRFLSVHKLVIVICLLLVAIPFFWFKPGYMDIGGDSTRLYFYDPIQYLKSYALNLFWPDSFGIKSSGTYMIPFLLFLTVLKFFLRSSYLLIGCFNGMSLVIGFLSIYAITGDILTTFHKNSSKRNIFFASVVSGLFYTFIPISSMEGWDLPLIIHTQSFVYPLIFWFLLRFVDTSRLYYLLFSVLVSFIFAQNFSWVGLPNMVSFFLTSFIFLGCYSYFFKKKKIQLKLVFGTLFIFLLVHVFQLIPLILSIFDTNTALNSQVAQGNALADTLHYVDAVASYTINAYQLFGLPPFSKPLLANSTLAVFPLLIIYMLIRNKEKIVIFITIFFLLLYYFVTANITKIGFLGFKKLFEIPGFVMFRDFYGRWIEIYTLFFSLLIGFSVYSFISDDKKYKKILLSILLVVILLCNAWPFISGQISNRILTQDTGVVVRSSMEMDPRFLNVLDYIKSYQFLGRNMILPFTDFGYQIVGGKNDDGAYFGPSMIAYLTAKESLNVFKPFTQAIYETAKEKNFTAFSNIFPLLNIRTLFYNSDTYIYEVFATFPYNDAKLYMPKTQSGYKEFISHLPLINTINFGNNYHMYTVDKSLQLPLLYTADSLHYLNSSNITKHAFYQDNTKAAEYILKNFLKDGNDKDLRKAFLENSKNISDLSTPTISFSKISNSKYLISLHNVTNPYLLVFSEVFDKNWKLFPANITREKEEANKKIIDTYFNNSIYEKQNNDLLLDKNIFETLNEKQIADSRHYLVNAYANAWYILPSDLKNRSSYTLILEMVDDQYVYLGYLISGVGIVLLLFFIVRDFITVKSKK